jgi:hypothetical protein
MAYLHAWFVAFVFTQLVEVPIYSVGLRVGIPAAFGASAITHPLLWFVIVPGLPLSGYARLAVAEVIVLLIEAAYFRYAFRRRHALPWSFVANGASLVFGLVCRHYFGVP